MTEQLVKIISGRYRNTEIKDVTVPLVKDYKSGARGGFITVNASKVVALREAFQGMNLSQIRVTVDDKANYSYVDENGVVTANRTVVLPGDTPEDDHSLDQNVEPAETDEEVMDRIAARFAILDKMAGAAAEGNVRAVIVRGPPGVGKSFGVERELEKYNLMEHIASRKPKYEIVKGAMTALGLYVKLHEYRDEGHVLVFDDCDSMFHDELSLNLLKAALDSGKRRMIHWNADSNMLRDRGIENKFEFKGSVIFITNIDFGHVRSKKLQDHLTALISRCHYIDLTMNTMRDRYLRIRQIARDSNLFPMYDLNEKEQEEILNFMRDNGKSLNEMSLRMAIKLADLRNTFEKEWQLVALTTCMKPGAVLFKAEADKPKVKGKVKGKK